MNLLLISYFLLLQIQLYTDRETFQLMGEKYVQYDLGHCAWHFFMFVYLCTHVFVLTGKEHALVISNHRSDIDWLVGWILAQVCRHVFEFLTEHVHTNTSNYA